MIAVEYKNLGSIDYAECWDVQKEIFEGLVAAKTNKKSYSDKESKSNRDTAGPEQTLILCEHPHVYTLGKSGQQSNLLIGEEFLKRIDATFFHIDRGGDITYHGPGQIVGYPILDLEKLGIGLREYIFSIEQAIIETVAEYGIVAGRLEGAAGVWIEPTERLVARESLKIDDDEGQVNEEIDAIEMSVDAKVIETVENLPLRKICAIGVRSSRFVTMHGFALNVNTQLEYFSYINPCGFNDRGVTSIEKELGHKVDIEDVKRRLISHLERLLEFKIK